MELFNEANATGMAQPSLSPEAPRPMTHNERLMELTQRMAEKDKEIVQLADAFRRMAQFVGFSL